MRASRLILVLAALTLSACGGDGLDELREFVKNAHAGRKPNPIPMPDIKPYEPYTYAALDLPDPFSKANLKPALTPASTALRPDMNRRKEPLEDYPLDALRMVGTLARERERWAVIQAPDGTVHRARIGNHIGQNFGRVIKISDERIDLVEKIPGGSGDWTERDASIAIAE